MLVLQTSPRREETVSPEERSIRNRLSLIQCGNICGVCESSDPLLSSQRLRLDLLVRATARLRPASLSTTSDSLLVTTVLCLRKSCIQQVSYFRLEGFLSTTNIAISDDISWRASQHSVIGFPRTHFGQSRSFICASNSTKSFENIRSSVNFCLRSASSISALANNGLQLSASRLKAHSGNFE